MIKKFVIVIICMLTFSFTSLTSFAVIDMEPDDDGVYVPIPTDDNDSLLSDLVGELIRDLLPELLKDLLPAGNIIGGALDTLLDKFFPEKPDDYVPENLNRIGEHIDPENPVYQVMKDFGCDLAAPITNEYDFGVLAMQFVFALFLVVSIVKLISRSVVGLFDGGLI